MREFNEYGERFEPPKKRRFNVFNNMNKDGKGVKKEDIITDFNFINFFKLYGRKFTRLIWVNALYILGNFPLFFFFLALSGYLSLHGPAPASELFPVINGIRVAAGEMTPSLAALFGIHGLMASTDAPTVITYVLYGISALFLFTFGPVNAACTYLVKNLLIGEPIFLWHDFRSTIRSNLKQAIPLGILDLAVLGLSFYALTSYYYNYGRYYILFYAMLLVLILYIFMRFYLYTMMILFDLSLPKIIKNSMIFSLLGFGRNFVLFLGILALLGMTVSLSTVFVPIGIGVSFMFLFSTCTFMGMYAAYPKIKKYMIDPYYKQGEEEEEE